MKAVISVTGKDNMGIIAKVSNKCTDIGANILDISQTVLSDYFVMIMLVDISKLSIQFGSFVDTMSELGKQNNLAIYTMHEDIFNSMHKI
ncbi:ACT domain-containing protein [Eubacteriales bacterium OttesenSCG-928-G02]|nr:ACT domain-containing protein [Eubacteriales bacterium OttesenSCG-928-G02]